jgi:hypothetical protein
MQWRDVSQNWAAYTPRIMTQWPNLDEAEVLSIDGDQDGFLAYLSKSKGEDRVAAVTMAEQNDNANIAGTAANVPAGEDVSDDDAKFGDDAVTAAPVGRVS